MTYSIYNIYLNRLERNPISEFENSFFDSIEEIGFSG